jgi:hypothetical protein
MKHVPKRFNVTPELRIVRKKFAGYFNRHIEGCKFELDERELAHEVGKWVELADDSIRRLNLVLAILN